MTVHMGILMNRIHDVADIGDYVLTEALGIPT